MSLGRQLGVMLAGTVVACNGILGIEDRPLRDDRSEGGVEGGGIDGGGVDGGRIDGGGAEGGTASAYRDAVIFDAPLVYLRFSEKDGTIAHDEVRHLDGAYPSTGVTLGAVGALARDSDTAIVLDGSHVIHMPDGADFADLAPFSVEAWFRTSALANPNTFLIDHETFTPRGGWDLLAGTGGVYFERWQNGSNLSTALEPPPSFDVWHHVVGTCDASVQRLYVDARLVGTTASVPRISAIKGGFSIGGQNCDCSGNKFVGALDELAIYDHELSATRIAAHFRAASP